MPIVELLHIFRSLFQRFFGVLWNLVDVIDEILDRFDGGGDSRERTNLGVITVIRIEGGRFETRMIAIV